MKKIYCVFLALLMFMISVPVSAADEVDTGEFEIVSITFDNPTPKALQTVNYTIKTKGDSSKFVKGSICYYDNEAMGTLALLYFYKFDSNEYKGSFTVGENMEANLFVNVITFSDENENVTVFSPDIPSDIDWDSFDLSISSDSEGRSDNDPPILQSATVSSDNISTTGKFYVDMVVTDNIYADSIISVEYSVNNYPYLSCANQIGKNTYRATFDVDNLGTDGIIKFMNINVCDGSDNEAIYTYSGEDGAIKIDYSLDVAITKSETDSEVSNDTDSTMDTDSEVSSDTDSTTETDSEVTSDTDSTTETDSEVVTEGSVKESKTDGAIVNDNNKNNDKVSNPNTGFGNTMWIYILSGVVLSAVIFIVYKKKVLKINK